MYSLVGMRWTVLPCWNSRMGQSRARTVPKYPFAVVFDRLRWRRCQLQRTVGGKPQYSPKSAAQIKTYRAAVAPRPKSALLECCRLQPACRRRHQRRHRPTQPLQVLRRLVGYNVNQLDATLMAEDTNVVAICCLTPRRIVGMLPCEVTS